MASIGQIVAAAGALAGGYVKGKQIARENDWEDEERAAKRQKWADDKALREALNGGTPDRNAPTMTAGATDLADVGSFSGGGAAPRSSTVPAEVVQRVGTNIYSDQDAAARAAEMENFASGADEGQGPKTEPTAAYRAKGVGIYADPAEAIAASQQAGEDARLGAVQQGVKKPDAADFLPHYLERIAPRVQAEYIRQGRIGDAKAFQDLMDSQDGKVYTRNWTNAVRKIEMGDLDGAVPDLAKLYTSYPDGRRAQATKLEGGKYQIDMIDEATGKTVNSFALESGDLVRKAAMALRPERLSEFLASQEGKRTAEAASLDKAIELETLRQEGQVSTANIHEDRRDDRFQKKLDAQAAALEKKLGAGGGLTVPQRRTNDAIDAARQQLTGMSQDDILRKTQSSLSSGRVNPEFDVNLSRAAKLATSRKYGEDPEHDKFSAGKSDANAAANVQAEIAKKFSADKAMSGYRLGPIDPKKGLPVVLDKSGQVIGHYDR